MSFTTESGLPSNEVSGVVETSDGTVWAATSLGIAAFDGFKWIAIPSMSDALKKRPEIIIPASDSTIFAMVDQRVYRCSTQGFQPLNLMSGGREVAVSALGFTPRLGLLIQGADGQLYTFRNNEVRQFAMPDSFSLFGGPQLFSDEKGDRFWVSTVKGLYCWNDGKWKLRFPSENNFFPPQSIVEKKDGTAFISVTPLESRGVWELKFDGTFRRIESEGREAIRTTDISPSGDIISVFESGDIRVYRSGLWSSLPYVPTQLRSVLFLKFRPNGDLWVGTETGLFLHKSSSKRWTYWKHPFPNLHNTVHEIIQTKDGSVWLGTESGVEIHKPDGTIKEITSIGGHDISIVTGLCEDSDGNVWISSGKSFEGAFRWDGKTWEFFGQQIGLVGRFHRIERDKNGRIWFLGIGETLNGNQPGAWVYDGKSFVHWGSKEGLLDDRVYSFESGTDGTLWFGSYTGISRLKHGAWKYWRSRSELTSTGIFTLALAQDGRLWFGDRGNGLGYIDTLDRSHYIVQSDGLINNAVWDLKVGAQGTLWISTRGGVSSYLNGTWSSFSLSTGLNSLKLWPILPVDDKVYIGTDGNGVDILQLDEANHPPPRIALDEPTTNSDRVGLRWKCYSYWGEVKPEVIQSRYRLDNAGWSRWDTRRGIILTGLDAGEHSVQFQAKDLFGKFDSVGLARSFTITPPLYLRPFFSIPLASLIVVVSYLGIALVIRRRNHSRALQESETKLRMITDTAASAIFIVQRDKLRFANPVMESITGYSLRELLELEFDKLIHPAYRDRLDSFDGESAAEANSPKNVELLIVRKDGAERWLDCIARKIQYEGRNALLGSAFDVTDRKGAEAKLISYQEQLQSLASELSFTEERERRRMASYLHDTISQALAFTKIKLETLMDAIAPSQYDKLLAEIHRFLNQSIDNAQSLTFELSPPILYELSLEDALQWLANQTEDQHQIKVQYYNDGNEKAVSDDVKLVLFHVVREMFANVIKHARASSIHLKLSREKDELQIIVEDDGLGFNTEILSSGWNKKDRFGLFHIRERLKSIGARFEISSEVGQGTYVLISVRLLKAQRGSA